MHDEAVAVLREALGWELPAAKWANVDAAVTRLAASADPDAEIGHLELAGPMRIITKYPEEPVAPMPDQTRERVNELIHSLSAPVADRADEAG
ncbi:CATRA system-associated protein [Nonomuraea sp. NPDC049028]|uniref:CATRA system-associated protein n=1 Tax=Nonomuraea sp. NPDC049028 TaxID=3364348 RepID=UPI003722F1C9